MKTVSSIKWTEESIAHIARHAIHPGEGEEACFNEDEFPYIRSGRDDLHYVFGKTFSGRFLFIVVKFIRRGEVKVITARDMNTWGKSYFRKEVNKDEKNSKIQKRRRGGSVLGNPQL